MRGKPLGPEYAGPGHKKRGGRKKGTRNRKTLINECLLGKVELLDLLARGSKELLLKPRHERIADLLKYAPPATQATLETLLLNHREGLPKATIALEGQVNIGTAIEAAWKDAQERKP